MLPEEASTDLAQSCRQRRHM